MSDISDFNNKGYRYPGEIISHAVWLYFRFTLSFRDIEELLAALKEVMPSVEHRQHKGSNNRAEISHQPTRQQERQMRRFKSSGQSQRSLSAHVPINNLFRYRRHLLTAADARTVRAQAFVTWQQVSCVQKAA